jgi:hypothetical protein
MFNVSVALLAAGWAVLALLQVTGSLVWDNRLLWVPACSFGIACSLALSVAAEHGEQRAASLAVALGSFASWLILALLWFFLFALVGK